MVCVPPVKRHEVYGIKESALRYWEKAGILSAKRMENQKYRDLSTNISRLLYLDILYYRKNGVAVKDMTDFDKMDEEQIFEMLEKTETKLDEQLALLNRQRDNLRQRQCMIKFLRDFGKKPYRLVKLPDLCLVTESEPYTRLLADNFPQSIITELALSTLETVTQPVAIRACIVSDRLKGKYRQMEVDLNARFVMTKYKEVLAGEALYTNGKKIMDDIKSFGFLPKRCLTNTAFLFRNRDKDFMNVCLAFVQVEGDGKIPDDFKTDLEETIKVAE